MEWRSRSRSLREGTHVRAPIAPLGEGWFLGRRACGRRKEQKKRMRKGEEKDRLSSLAQVVVVAMIVLVDQQLYGCFTDHPNGKNIERERKETQGRKERKTTGERGKETVRQDPL